MVPFQTSHRQLCSTPNVPAKSKAQYDLMALVANDPEFAKKVGIKRSVANEFLQSDKGRTFTKGSTLKPTINKAKTNHGKSTKFFAEGGSMKPNLKSLFKGKDTKGEELKEAKAIKSGKLSPMQYAKGEKMEDAMKPKGKPFAKGGGVETKGKTKGRFVTMACGGKVKK